MVMTLILYELVLIVKTRNLAHNVALAKTATMPVPKTNTIMKTNGEDETMTIFEDLYKLNQTIVETSIDYSVKKIDLKKTEAKLLLETDFETELGKKRPTVDEKKAYLLLQTVDQKEELEAIEMNLDALKREYSIKKLEAKMTGNFLNTLAGVVDDDD